MTASVCMCVHVVACSFRRDGTGLPWTLKTVQNQCCKNGNLHAYAFAPNGGVQGSNAMRQTVDNSSIFARECALIVQPISFIAIFTDLIIFVIALLSFDPLTTTSAFCPFRGVGIFWTKNIWLTLPCRVSILSFTEIVPAATSKSEGTNHDQLLLKVHWYIGENII